MSPDFCKVQQSSPRYLFCYRIIRSSTKRIQVTQTSTQFIHTLFKTLKPELNWYKTNTTTLKVYRVPKALKVTQTPTTQRRTNKSHRHSRKMRTRNQTSATMIKYAD